MVGERKDLAKAGFTSECEQNANAVCENDANI